MKKGIYTFIAAALLLSGCGGGGGGSATSSTSTTTVSGSVLGSYLQGVIVCEAGTTNCVQTDINGRFSLATTTFPVTLELKIGNSLLASLNATKTNLTITPLVLADNNTTAAAYIGAMLHKIAGCAIGDLQCDFTGINSVDINATLDLPLVEELLEELTINQTTIKLTIDHEDDNFDRDDNLSEEDALIYESTNPEMVGEENLTYTMVGFSVADPSIVTTSSLIFDPENATLTNIYPNLTTTTTQLQEIYEKVFFKPADTNTTYTAGFFLSKTVAISYAYDTSDIFIIGGLMTTDRNLTEADVKLFANKTYNIASIFETNLTGTIELNATDPTTLIGTWKSNDANGTWEINGNTIMLYETNATTILYFKPSEGRQILYYITFDNDTATLLTDIGFLIEAAPLKPEEFNEKFAYLAMDLNVSAPNFCVGEATFAVDDLNNTSFHYIDAYCEGNTTLSSNTYTSLILNPQIDLNATTTVTYNGVAEVNTTGEFLIYAPESNFFLLLDPNTQTFAIGSEE